MVGDESCLPVTAVGFAPGSFRLPNVLVAPQMVHNLLSIRQFTADNSCSIEFDSSGLTVKDSASRHTGTAFGDPYCAERGPSAHGRATRGPGAFPCTCAAR